MTQPGTEYQPGTEHQLGIEHQPGTEKGNAVVGFTATVGLLLLVALSVIGVGLTWYAQAVMTDCVALGARTAGLAGVSEEQARARTAELMTTTLPADYADDIQISYGSNWVEVRARAQAPVIGLLLPITIEVQARAPRE